MSEYSMGDTLDIRRKRLLFRSWRRGTRESDLLLGAFAERYLGGWGAAELDRYEALLGNSDAELFDWIAGRAAPAAEQDTDILRLLLDFRYGPRSA
jgi:antitoxin CptB